MSSDSVFTVRSSKKQEVMAGVLALGFPTAGEPYTVDDSDRFTTGLIRVLKGTFNPAGGGNGMAELASSSKGTPPSALATIKSTDAAVADEIIAADLAKKQAAAKAAGKEPTDVMEMALADANDIADRKNLFTQAVIGAKEGAAAAIKAKVGAKITDTVLRTSDGTDAKGVDDWELYELVQAIKRHAQRPKLSAPRKLLVALANYRFDFRQRVATNVTDLRTMAGKLAAYGSSFPDHHLAAVILAEIEWAATQEWGRDIRAAVDKIRLAYPYDHPHDATSLRGMLDELALADNIRNLQAAPASTEQANAASNVERSEVARKLLFEDSSDDEYSSDDGTAATAESASASEASRKSRAKRKTKRNKDKGRARSSSRQRDRDDWTAENNPCKHCRKHKRINRHPNADESECYFNKKYKGFRPRYVCKAMKIKYHPPHVFETSEDESSSGEE